MTLRTERCANRALTDYSDTTKRFARSTAQAFAHERFNTVSHYVSNRMRHRLWRFVRALFRRLPTLTPTTRWGRLLAWLRGLA